MDCVPALDVAARHVSLCDERCSGGFRVLCSLGSSQHWPAVSDLFDIDIVPRRIERQGSGGRGCDRIDFQFDRRFSISRLDGVICII